MTGEVERVRAAHPAWSSGRTHRALFLRPFHRSPMIRTLALCMFFGPAVLGMTASAQEMAPTWGSIAANRAYLRAGPGTRFPVEWVFTAPDLPVHITDRHGNWREVITPDGESGWMHHSLLSHRLTALVIMDSKLRRKPVSKSEVRAQLKTGAVVQVLDTCGPTWCRVKAEKWKGYVPRTSLWGPMNPNQNPH